jgi:hypothetical protein
MGSPVKESKALAKRLDEIEDENKLGVIQSYQDGATTKVVAPAKYYERDDRDDYYEAKAAVTKEAVAGTGAGAIGNKVLVTDDDIKYLLDQRKKEELYNYDQWFYQTFRPGADPNKLALARDLNPDWFKRREQEINQQIEIAKKLAKLGLRGPRNQKEVELMYAIDTGRVQVPDLDMLFPEKAALKTNLAAYEKARSVTQGFFNPRRYTHMRDIKGRKLSQRRQPFIENPSSAGIRANISNRARSKDADAGEFYKSGPKI